MTSQHTQARTDATPATDRLLTVVNAVTTTVKAYRLLKAIMNTAVDDGLIRRNLCWIKGAAQETSPERPVLTVAQVHDLADAINPRYRALVLLAAFGSLRWGELAALRRCDIDLKARTTRIGRQLTETEHSGLTFGLPKSDAGLRTVPLPAMIVPDLARHMKQHAQDGGNGLVFTSPSGTLLPHGNFYRRAWLPAVGKASLTAVHFHDLRTAGNLFTAHAGANPRELMARMGHPSTRAAMIYLHSTDERQRTLADAVDRTARAELRKAKRPAKPRQSVRSPSQTGTKVARGGKQA
jgi:integrase